MRLGPSTRAWPGLQLAALGLAAAAPSVVLQGIYFLPLETPLLGRLLILLTTGFGAAFVHLLLFRVQGFPGLLAVALLNAPLILLLGGYGQVFSDSPSLFSVLHQTREALAVNTTWTLFTPWLLCLVVPLSLFGLLVLGRPTPRPASARIALLGLAWLALLGVGKLPLWGSGERRARRCQQGWILNSLQDAWQAYRTWDDRSFVTQLLQDRRDHPPASLGSPRPFHSRLLILQLESLDYQALRHRVGGKPVLPFLERLTGQVGVLLLEPNHSGSSGSGGSDFQLLTGLRPLCPKPAYTLNRLDWNDALPRHLRQKGIPFIAIHGNEATFWGRQEPFARMGMEAFLDQDRILPLRDARWGVSDRATFRKALAVAQERPGPLALFVITLSSHAPFDLVPPKAFPGTSTQERFFNSIAYLDECLAGFFSALPAREPWTVIMYGDHASRLPGAGYQSLVVGKERVPCWIFEWTGQGAKPMAFPQLSAKMRQDGTLEIASLFDLIRSEAPEPPPADPRP